LTDDERQQRQIALVDEKITIARTALDALLVERKKLDN
jgi:hypothetical protein